MRDNIYAMQKPTAESVEEAAVELSKWVVDHKSPASAATAIVGLAAVMHDLKNDPAALARFLSPANQEDVT